MILLNSDSIASIGYLGNGRFQITRADRDEISQVSGPIKVKLAQDVLVMFSADEDGQLHFSPLKSSLRKYDEEFIKSVVRTVVTRVGQNQFEFNTKAMA